MKSLFKISVVIALFSLTTMTLTGCSENEAIDPSDDVITTGEITGKADSISTYGEIVLDVKTADLNKVGIAYSDVVDIAVGDSIVLLDVPFVTSFNEVPLYSPCLCDYNATGKYLSLGMGCGDFTHRIGGHLGDKITITLKTKGGYEKTREMLNSQYSYERGEYDSDEMFANFRMVTTTGMRAKALYRSGNPMNYNDNKARYQYVDQLARQANIATEINLADTDDKIAQYRSELTNNGVTYCLGLYDQGQTICLGLTADAFSEKFMTRLADGLRFMAEHDAPYLIHCNEGKDRCGFVSMLLESLAGATYEEVTEDYMMTFYNLMRITPSSDSYSIRKEYSVDRMIYLMGNLDMAEHPLYINWNTIQPEKVDLHTAARNYMMKCGLTENEVNTLENKLK